MWKNLIDDAEARGCLANIDDPNLSSVRLKNMICICCREEMN